MVCAPVRRDNPRALARGLSIVQAHKLCSTYLTCTMISSVDLAHYIVSRAKDKVSVNCGTNDAVFFILVVDLNFDDMPWYVGGLCQTLTLLACLVEYM